MEKITVYRYKRKGGGVTVSPTKPNGEYTELFRLVADMGMVLTDGNIAVSCVDTEDATAWEEIKDPSKDYDPYEATEADYKKALHDMGVDV